MRIAMLAAYLSSASAGKDKKEGLETIVSGLVQELRAGGSEIELFTHHIRSMNGLDVTGLLLLAGVFERAHEFDLIHTHDWLAPLTYSMMTDTPVVITHYTALSEDQLSVARKYKATVHCITTNDRLRCPELDYSAVIPIGHDMAEFADAYSRVYTKIVHTRAREDQRPWGYYRILSDEPNHKVKRIIVYPGKRLSLQRHHRRSEHWFVVRGEMLVTRDREEIMLRPGQSIEIPNGAVHRVTNLGREEVAFIEIQTGDYFGEDDIERFEDDYGRI